MVSLDIKVNDLIVKNEKPFRYAMELLGDRMLFVPLNPGDGPEFTCSEKEFEELLLTKKLSNPPAVIRDAEGNIIAEDEPFDIAPGDEDSPKVNRARSLFFFLQKCYAESCSLYHEALDSVVFRHSKEARDKGLKWAPSSGTLHRWLNKFPNPEGLTARFLVSKSGQVKRQRWHPKVAELLERLIDFYWEADTRTRNYVDAYAEFDDWFDDVAAELAKDPAFIGPLNKPSEETLRNYINSAECYDTWGEKFSYLEADARFAGNKHPVPATKLLEVVMIDSTVLDAWCVLDDETLLPLGRPTLTVAIDVYTRCVLAAIVTYEPPSLFTAMACLKRVHMPKWDVNVRYPSVERVSDAWGHPTTVIVDNGLEQIGKSYQSAAEDARIHVRWAPVKRPQFKAIVERFFRTLNDLLIHKLPGGLPYKPELMRQLGIDPAEICTITLSKLNELVHKAIHDVYHYAPHSTIGMQPARAWELSKRKHKRPYIADPDFLDMAFGALDDGVLTTSGIRFDNMVFHDPAITTQLLNDLAHTEPKRRRRKSRLSSAAVHVMFKYNPADVSKINVWNPKTKRYVPLPNALGEAAAGLSKWHFRILRIWAAQENVAFSTPAELSRARRQLREIAEKMAPKEAYESIKRMRRIIHEPSQVVEGSVVLMTTATPTVGGMGDDNVEVEVQLFAPEGPRIPPKGPDRGKRKGHKRQKPAASSEKKAADSHLADENARRRVEELAAAFTEDVRPAPEAPPARRDPDDFDAAFDSVLREAAAAQTKVVT